MSTIITKNSSTASAVPTPADLEQGELAVNVTDKRLFTKNSGGSVVELGTNPTSVTTGAITATGADIGNLTLGSGSITDSSGSITFGNENISTTGTFASGNITVTGNISVSGTVDGVDVSDAVTFSASDVSSASWFIDEDAMSSDSAVKVPSQQSVKAYVDNTVIAIGAVTVDPTPVADDFAKFTNSTELTGRSYAEVRSDLSLEVGTDVQAQNATLQLFADLGLGAANYSLTVNSAGTALEWKDRVFQEGTEFTASGPITIGDVVVLNDDGTVSIVTDNSTVNGAESAVVFESGTTEYPVVCYDTTNNKVVVAYRDSGDSGKGKVAVGTISSGVISFGTPVEFESGSTTDISITFDSSAGKVLIAYVDAGASNAGRVVAGTVSGTSISFGTIATFLSTNVENTTVEFDVSDSRSVIAYRDGNDGGAGVALSATISGTSVSVGATNKFEAGSTTNLSSCYDSTNEKIVIAYEDGNDGNAGKCVVCTTGASLSIGGPVTFASFCDTTSCAFDSVAGKVLIAYRGTTNKGTAIVGTVSGSSISYGTASEFDSDNAPYISVVYNSSSNNFVIVYTDTGNSSYGTFVVATISGTSVSFGTAFVFNSTATTAVSQGDNAAYDPDSNRVIAVFRDSDDSNKGKAVVCTTAGVDTDADNFLGFAQETVSDSETLKIKTDRFIDTNQSGLTQGQGYWVDTDGSLSSTDTGYPKAGTAVGTDKIQIGV